MTDFPEPLLSEICDLLSSLSGEEFQNVITRYLREQRKEFIEVEAGPRRGADGGVDILGRVQSPTMAIEQIIFQCKKSNVGRSDIDSLFAAASLRAAQQGVMVSPKELSQSGRDEIEAINRRGGLLLVYKDWTHLGLARTMLLDGSAILAEQFPVLKTRIGFPDKRLRIAPSFRTIDKVQFGGAAPLADSFLNGFPATWGDLAAAYDLPREMYHGANGLSSAVERALERERPGLTLFSLVGVAGAGKSTILRRLAYDFALKGFKVSQLRSDWMEPSIPILKQLADLIELSTSPTIVILDNAAPLFRDEPLNSEAIALLLARSTRPVVLVAADEPQHWYAIDRKYIETHENVVQRMFHLGELTAAECESLVDHLVGLETKGLLTRQAGASLDRHARLELCVGHAQRQMLVALLQLRHAKGFVRIIRDEFERLGQYPTYQAAYGLTCFAQLLFDAVPETLLLRVSGVGGYLEVASLWRQMDKLLIRRESGVVVRHARIAREVVNAAFLDPSAAQAALSSLLGGVDSSFQREAKFFTVAFAFPGKYRRYLQEFSWSHSITDQFYEAVLAKQSALPGYYKKFLYTSWGQAAQALNKTEDAVAKFKTALDLDSGYGFALRQWAWVEHSRGRFVDAAALAIRAADLEPENKTAQHQCARILSLNTLGNFRRAGEYYERSLALDPQDARTRRRFGEWNTVNTEVLPVVSGLQEDQILPSYIAEVLRPGLSYLRGIFSPKSSEVRKALHNRLFGMQEDIAADEGAIRELIGDVNIGKDKRLRAVVSCNIARSRYLDWYHSRVAMDQDEVERLFKEAIANDDDNPFSHCWYGTFLKEVRADYSQSMKSYRAALARANKSKSDWIQQHPLILNNLALLLMDQYRLKLSGREALSEAQKFIKTAIQRIEARDLAFYWPYSTAKELEQLLAEVEEIEA